MWGAAEYERIAERFAPIHDRLIAALGVKAGDRVLDVATGTGEVALRAARLGAYVTGLDLAPALLEQARAKAEHDGLEIDWVEGNAERLPFDDGTFDVVCSNFGVIFAPDVEAAARELGRVCADGGRLGLSTWKPNEGLHRIYAILEEDGGTEPAEEWGLENRVRELLGADFDLTIEEAVWALEGDSHEEVWELMTAAAPPCKALVERLEPERLAEFRSAMLGHWAGFARDGRVSEPRGYLVVLGRRR
jgi:SAM-dependent methyltransferase